MTGNLAIDRARNNNPALFAGGRRRRRESPPCGGGQAVARGPWVLTLAVLAGMVSADLLCGRLARGQDDWDAGKPAANQPDARMVMRQTVMAPEVFDRWVSGGRTPEQMERSLDSLLALQVESVARVCGLSDAQREKLELAGHGDVKRLSRSIEQLKEKFRGVGQDQQKFSEMVREVSPLQMKMQTGVFGDSSLYRKVLNQTLDREQSVRYEQDERQRRKFRYEARIELVLSDLESSIPIRAEQRQRFVKLLLDETQPPKKFGQYDTYIVLCQARKLGEAKLKPIFDDAQWQALKKVLDQSQRMEQHLQANGFLP
jgi:hypothetical protein